MAYQMGMRKVEIVRLIWPEVDFKKGFIRYQQDEQRQIHPEYSIHPEVKTMLESLPRDSTPTGYF